MSLFLGVSSGVIEKGHQRVEVMCLEEGGRLMQRDVCVHRKIRCEGRKGKGTWPVR